MPLPIDLGILLRALVVPLLLAITVVLSFAAALGVSSLVFHSMPWDLPVSVSPSRRWQVIIDTCLT